MKRVVIGALVLILGFARPAFADDTVTLSVRDASLTDVLLLIARAGHFNLVPDATIEQRHISALSLQNVPARSALDALEQGYGLREIVRDGYIRLVPGTAYGTIADRQAGNVTVSIAVPAGQAQAVIGPLQNALQGALVMATSNGHAIVVTGPPDLVARAQALISQLTTDPISAFGVPTAIPTSNILPSTLLTALQSSGYGLAGLYFTPDDSRMLLYVRGPDSAIAQVRAAAATFDVPVPMVTFRVRVVDLTPQQDSSDIGLQPGGTTQTTSSSSTGTSSTTSNLTVGSAIASLTNRSIPIEVQINAQISKGTAFVKAEPSVAVVNGETGKILVGSQRPIAINNGSLIGGSNVQFVQVGAQLQIQPRIGANGTIDVQLVTTYSEVDGTDPTSGYPIIGQRTVQSHLVVHDHEPIIIAGLFQDFGSDTIQKIPGLSAIPVLGQIFQNRAKSHEVDEIVFELMPEIGVKPGLKGDFHGSN